VRPVGAYTFPRPARWDIVAAVLSLLVRLVVTGVAIWVAAEIIDGVTLGTASTSEMLLTLGGVAVIFTVVNALVRPLVVLLSLPAYILTLGLFTFVVNALMLWLTSWIAEQLDLAFNVADFFWAAILGSLVISFVSWVLTLVLPTSK
jgi:putative membrane protein